MCLLVSAAKDSTQLLTHRLDTRRRNGGKWTLHVHPNRPNLLISGSADKTVKLWDLRNTSQPVSEYTGHSHDVVGCAFSAHDPDLLVSTSKDGSVKVWNINGSNSPYCHIPQTGKVNSCLAAPLVALPDAAIAKSETSTSPHSTFTVAPKLQGNCFAVGGMDGTISLASISSGSVEQKATVEIFCSTATSDIPEEE